MYSASAYASAELPDLDVSLRGAVSIARRLQDPLAELVKIDPKSIGVGPVPARPRRDQAVAVAGRRGRGLRERGRRRREHRVGCRCCAGSRGSPTAWPRTSCSTATPTARSGPGDGADGCAQARPEGVRAVRRLPADPRRRRPARLPPACTPRPTRWSAASSRRPGATLPGLIGNTAVLQSLRPQEFVDDTFGVPTVTDILRGAGEAGARPAAGVPDRHLRRRRREGRPTCAPAWCWRGWSPTWPPSAPSSTSASTRTVWCTSRRCRAPSSRTRARWSKPGDVVRVKVLDVDVPRSRIGLTLRLDDEVTPGGAADVDQGPLDAGGGRSSRSRSGKPGRQGPGSGGRRPGAAGGAPAPSGALADAFRRAGYDPEHAGRG